MKNILLLILFIFLSNSVFSQGYNEERNYIRNTNEIPELGPTTGVSISIAPGTRTEIPSTHPPLHTPPPDVTPEPSEDRNIYWIHGFGGDVDSWSKAMDATTNGTGSDFPARKAVSYSPTYSSEFDLDVAQAFLKHNILHLPPPLGPDTRDFIIGHSQGGIVSRAMISTDFCVNEITWDKPYGGLVTFGSALNGAQIMNSRDDGDIQSLVNKTADIFYLPLAELIDEPEFFQILFEFNQIFDLNLTIIQLIDFKEQNSWIVELASAVLQWNFVQNSVKEKVHNQIDQAFAFKVFGDLASEIGSDYVVGSPVIDNYNSCIPSGIDMLAYYGTEPYEPLPNIDFKNPIAYRTIQYMIKKPTEYPTWGANDDSELAQIAQNVQEIFYGRSNYFQMAADYWEQYSACGIEQYISNPKACAVGTKKYQNARKLTVAHRLAAEWFENINDEWMGLIGASGVTATNVGNYSGFCDCLYDEDIDANIQEILDQVSSQQECLDLPDEPQYAYFSDCKWRYSTFYTVQYDLFEKVSDGVVLAESAKYLTGAQYDPRVLDNSSHMQMRNNTALKGALLDLYDGDTGSNFFKTDPK